MGGRTMTGVLGYVCAVALFLASTAATTFAHNGELDAVGCHENPRLVITIATEGALQAPPSARKPRCCGESKRSNRSPPQLRIQDSRPLRPEQSPAWWTVTLWSWMVVSAYG